MEEKKLRFPWFGIALIIFGAALLLRRMDIISVAFSQIFWSLMMVVGIVGVGRGFANSRRGRVFWGTVLFLYSLFFLLRSLDSVEIHFYMFFPGTFLIFGLAFVMMYLQDVRDWFLLIPALFLCAIGILLLLTETGYLYRWEVWEAIHLYWPVVLILLGIALIFRRRKRRSDQVQTDVPGTSTMMLS